MAYSKVYTRINWVNKSEGTQTPLGATNLNTIDYAVDELDNRVIEQETLKLDKATALTMISDWSMDEETGIITITKLNGEQIVFDLNIEKIPVNFALSEDGIVTMTTDDGTEFTANIGDMIPVLEFKSSDEIAVTVTGEGKDKTYSFSIKEGSIKEKHLQPNYLADIKVQAANAQSSADAAAVSEANAKTSEANAKTYAEQAKEVGAVEVMTEENNGIGKPDGDTITVDENGTFKAIKAEQDGNGKVISDTYATKTELQTLTDTVGEVNALLDTI